MVPELNAEFPSAYASVGKARRAIAAFAREWFDGIDLADIESAAGEALANCAEHGHRNGAAIRITCRADSDKLTIEFQDAGNGFDHWSITTCREPGDTKQRGFGIAIMHRLMDEVVYSERGTRLRLVKRRPNAVRAARGERGD